MNREIKFRIYDFNLEKFHYVYFIDCLPVTEYANHCHSGELSEPQEYTGLLDKNGKEIYEGDIVILRNTHDDNISTGNKYEIIFRDCNFCATDKTRKSNYWLGSKNINYIEVIGNIYENPELLKDK